MRVAVKNKESGQCMWGNLVTAEEALDSNQRYSRVIHPREIVFLEDKETIPLHGPCYELKELAYILKWKK